MPMGIVSDSDFELEVNRHKKGTEVIPKIEEANDLAIIKDIQHGRTKGRTEIPEIIRESVARASINGSETGAKIAAAFDISPSSVSAYKVGATSTASYHQPDEDLLSVVQEHRRNISRNARHTLLSALENITPDKLSSVRPRDLAGIAKDMSAIITDMEPPMPAIHNQQNVQFVFMAPRVRNEDSYEIREVND